MPLMSQRRNEEWNSLLARLSREEMIERLATQLKSLPKPDWPSERLEDEDVLKALNDRLHKILKNRPTPDFDIEAAEWAHRLVHELALELGVVLGP
jgi:hypothetical protein